MNPIPWFQICSRLGLPPATWMVQNPIKRYEFASVTNSVNLSTADVILDVGCGKGHWTIALSRHCRQAVGVDTSPDQIKTAHAFVRHSRFRSRVSFYCNSLEKLEFPNNHFDHVFSFCVLEHVKELESLLMEIACVLKPGGQFHFSVDSLENLSDPEILTLHTSQHNVVQYFTANTLCDQLEDAGLRVKNIYPILTSSYAVQEFKKRIRHSYKYGLIANQRIFRHLAKQDQVNGCNQGIILIAHGISAH